MPYIKSVTKAGNTMIIEKYYSSRWKKKGMERGTNTNKTSAAQEKCNLRKAERKLTILLNANFEPGDWHLVIDYAPGNRPSTPRGRQEERKAVFREDQKAVPEGWHGDEVCRGRRIWKEGSIAPSHHNECLCRCDE